MGSENPEYYPFRWKIADAVEDLFALHRRKLILGAALLLAGIAVGVLLFVDGDDADQIQTANTQTTATTATTTTPTTETTEAPATTETTAAQPASRKPRAQIR